jgi:hypothetical protein
MLFFQEVKQTNCYFYSCEDGTDIWSQDRMTQKELAEYKDHVDAVMDLYVDEEALFGAHFIMGEPRTHWSF